MRVFSLLLLVFLPLSAQAITGDAFMKQCDAAFTKPDKDTPPQVAATRLIEAGTCVGYVGGALSGIALMSSLMREQNVIKKNLICLPGTVTPRDMYDQVMKEIRADKKDRDKKQVRAYIYEHFVKTYACPDEPAAPAKK
ncbi:MAG: Rap1a/Tai family immunity protein [Gammaproteobacteria bacterium]|nr:Rap1a/Tai family immunity protein [Gammaproteobacteria bacterium]